MSWRVLIDPPRDGPENMAIDEALLESCASEEQSHLFPTVRFYRWKVPTLSIGYNQRIEEAVDRAICSREGIDVIRRQTGGKAVLHDRELTYSFVSHFFSPPFSPRVSENYRIISEGLKEGLKILGIDASIAGDEYPVFNAQLKGHCFNRLSRHEISHRGLKLIGSAQRVRRKAFLQHGSLFLDSDRELFERITMSSPVRDRNAGFTTVREATGRDVRFEELVDALIAGFQNGLKVKLIRSELTEEEERLAMRLKTGKYLTDAWNEHI